MPNLYALHDIEGAPLVPGGGWCVPLVSLSEDPSPKIYARTDINHLVRVNWGYGVTGTIPQPHQLQDYMAAMAAYVSRSRGIWGIIVGNEPNHEQERPGGMLITPEYYAQVYRQVYALVKNINHNIQVVTAAPAPYHASPIAWTVWYSVMLDSLRMLPDGLAIHAYTREHSRDSVYSVEKMGGVLQDTFNGFLTYRDALAEVPDKMRHLPVYITEFNPIPGWKDENNGMVKAAYEEINWWNAQPDTQRIHFMALYRYPKYDKWGIVDKPQVIEDFRSAVALGLQSPQNGVEGRSEAKQVTLMPSIKVPPKNAPGGSVEFQRIIDPNALARGVTIVEVNELPAWKVKHVHWFDEKQADALGPDHHILISVVDENGTFIPDVSVKVIWPTGFTTVVTKRNPDSAWNADYPMSGSLNEFSVLVSGTELPTEMVRGIGMGKDGNKNIHTSTMVTFQRVAGVLQDTPDREEPVQQSSINLVHPVKDTRHRRITQLFGANPEFYKQFIYDGVPLQGHNGLDFGTPLHSVIVAVDSGRVQEAQLDPDGWGNYIKLVHSWGESLYAHLENINVTVGDLVTKGQSIALSGNTGISTGPHLHFGMRTYPYQRNDGWGGFRNPLPWLNATPLTPQAPTTDHKELVKIIKQVAQEQQIDWRLLASLAWNESSFRPEIKFGLFQIEDPAWQDFAPKVNATDRLNPLHNARVGASYLKFLLNRYQGNIWKAVTAYNMGFVAFERGDEPQEPTRTHAAKVTSGYDLLRAVGEG